MNAPSQLTTDKPWFLPYQERWIHDQSPLKIMEKSRQIGITYADAYDSVLKVTKLKPVRNVWVSSRDDLTARQYLQVCKQWARILHIGAQELGERIVDSDKDLTAYVLKFANGKCIFSLSSNPDALVGKTGHIKLDEFAVHKNQRELFRIAKPCTTWGGQLAIISTHRGHATVFNEILRDIKERGNPMRWSHHRVTLEDAVAQGLAEKIQKVGRGVPAEPSSSSSSTPPFVVPPSGGPASVFSHSSNHPSIQSSLREQFISRLRSECIDEEQWLQEYCCVATDDSAAFITHEMISACEHSDCLKAFEYLEGCANHLYVGVDVARKKHLCVIDVGERIGDVIWSRHRIELRDRPFSEIREELYRVLSLPKVMRCCIDQTGLGMQLAEEAKERFGWKVEAVNFSLPVKEELAFHLRNCFEDRLLRIDPSPALRADLRGIRKETTVSGNIRFVAESEESHCDRFWAMALRQHAANYKQVMGFAFLD